MESITLTVAPAYHQFYLRRGEAPWAPDEALLAAEDTGAAAVNGFVFVGTTTWGQPTEVTIDVNSGLPADRAPAERTVDLALTGDGALEVFGGDDIEPLATIDLPPGPLRLRVSWAAIEEAAADPHAEYGDLVTPSPESVHVQVWPEPPTA